MPGARASEAETNESMLKGGNCTHETAGGGERERRGESRWQE
tara:strand:+ start:240 stop:365 length:126 start_codon:yes stop_codon:yes gene_type:complete